MADEFDARRSRGKRPLPLWVDAFLRDTPDLSGDEIGAYLLILMAMWSRPSCDFPNDERRLARVARVSLRLWRSRVGPAVMGFFEATDDAVASKRLQAEAEFVERSLSAQSARSAGREKETHKSESAAAIERPKTRAKTRPKPMTNNIGGPSADETTGASDAETADPSGDYPTQLPNNPTLGGGDSPRDGSIYDLIRGAAGIQDEPDHRRRAALGLKFSDPYLLAHLTGWRGLGLSDTDIVKTIAGIVEVRGGSPPDSPKYFTAALSRLAGERSAAQPVATQPSVTDGGSRNAGRPRARTAAERRAAQAAEAVDGRLGVAAAFDRRDRGC